MSDREASCRHENEWEADTSRSITAATTKWVDEMEFQTFLITNFSLITQPIQLQSSPFEKLDLNYIFIFEIFNYIVTETPTNTNGTQGNSEKAGHKSVDSL